MTYAGHLRFGLISLSEKGYDYKLNNDLTIESVCSNGTNDCLVIEGHSLFYLTKAFLRELDPEAICDSGWALTLLDQIILIFQTYRLRKTCGGSIDDRLEQQMNIIRKYHLSNFTLEEIFD